MATANVSCDQLNRYVGTCVRLVALSSATAIRLGGAQGTLSEFRVAGQGGWAGGFFAGAACDLAAMCAMQICM